MVFVGGDTTLTNLSPQQWSAKAFGAGWPKTAMMYRVTRMPSLRSGAREFLNLLLQYRGLLYAKLPRAANPTTLKRARKQQLFAELKDDYAPAACKLGWLCRLRPVFRAGSEQRASRHRSAAYNDLVPAFDRVAGAKRAETFRVLRRGQAAGCTAKERRDASLRGMLAQR